MRHNVKKGLKLGTDASHTKAMKKSLVGALFLNDRIKTIDSRAKAASEGLKVGDVITAVDGTPTPTMDEVNTVKADKKAGDKLTLSVYRISEDKTINLTITLTDAHDLEGDDPAETQQQNQSQNDNSGNYGNGYGSFGGFSSPFSSFGW